MCAATNNVQSQKKLQFLTPEKASGGQSQNASPFTPGRAKSNKIVEIQDLKDGTHDVTMRGTVERLNFNIESGAKAEFFAFYFCNDAGQEVRVNAFKKVAVEKLKYIQEGATITITGLSIRFISFRGKMEWQATLTENSKITVIDEDGIPRNTPIAEIKEDMPVVNIRGLLTSLRRCPSGESKSQMKPIYLYSGVIVDKSGQINVRFVDGIEDIENFYTVDPVDQNTYDIVLVLNGCSATRYNGSMTIDVNESARITKTYRIPPADELDPFSQQSDILPLSQSDTSKRLAEASEERKQLLNEKETKSRKRAILEKEEKEISCKIARLEHENPELKSLD